MIALVTNDDGIDSSGLRVLAATAREVGMDLLVAAPRVENSGASASLTILREGGRLAVQDTTLDEIDTLRCVAVESTPAFIVWAAVAGAFGPVPDVVLSGVNHGPNTGQAVLHSGTVGAVLTGANQGLPGVAFSNVAAVPAHLGDGAEVIRQVLSWLVDDAPAPSADPLALNVNLPDLPADKIRGIRPAVLAAFGAVQAHVGGLGEGFVTMTFAAPETSLVAGTDAALLAQGGATVTPLAAPWAVDGVDLAGLVDPRDTVDRPSTGAG